MRPPPQSQGYDHRHQQQVANGEFHTAVRSRLANTNSQKAMPATRANVSGKPANQYTKPIVGGSAALTIIRLRRLNFIGAKLFDSTRHYRLGCLLVTRIGNQVFLPPRALIWPSPSLPCSAGRRRWCPRLETARKSPGIRAARCRRRRWCPFARTRDKSQVEKVQTAEFYRLAQDSRWGHCRE